MGPRGVMGGLGSVIGPEVVVVSVGGKRVTWR